MSYVMNGTIRGALCDECSEPLAGIEVRLYAAAAAQSPTEQVVAAVERVQVGAATVRDDGSFHAAITHERYQGGELDLDIYCGSVPRPKFNPHAPVQQTLTTTTPAWEGIEDQLEATADFLVPDRDWCQILALFGVWTICGHLTSCKSGAPIPGATVKAFDADWLQDDYLGSANTDSVGHFLISYTAADFRETPFSPILNIELTEGPDVYFTVELGGQPILTEHQGDGRQVGRQNIGNCFCVELCTELVDGDPGHVPHWQQVEVFDIHPAPGNVGAHFTTDGDTTVDHYVFGGQVSLGGNCPLVDQVSGHELEYRFTAGEYSWAGPETPGQLPSVAPVAPLAGLKTQLGSAHIGYVFYIDGNGIQQSEPVNISAADADPNGWIQIANHKTVTVPMYNPVGTTQVVTVRPSNFLRTFTLATINTVAITATHPARLPGVLTKADAGRSLTTGEQEPVRRYTLGFEVRDAHTHGPVMWSDALSAIIFDNTPVQTALDLEELHSNACNPLGGVNTIHLLYTVDHPALRNFTCSIASNSGTFHTPSTPPVGGNNAATPASAYLPGMAFPWFRGGAGGPHNGTNTGGLGIDISTDPHCAYAVNLSWVTRRYGDLGQSTQILYCH